MPRLRTSTLRKFLSVLLITTLASMAMTGLAASLQERYVAAATAAKGDILINEVAWGGTIADNGAYWVELYNNTNIEMPLTNITLRESDSGNSIAFSGTLPAKSYLLIEVDESVTTVASGFLWSDLTKLFATSTKQLYLFDGENLIDSANISGGDWPAGTINGEHCSMERVHGYSNEIDQAWQTSTNKITATDSAGNAICGTPGAANTAVDVTETPTPTATVTKAPSKSVIINEIAWMGTVGDTEVFGGDEWIELYNTTNKELDLAGWSLITFDTANLAEDTFEIRLTGKIPAFGYYVLERGVDLVISNKPADQVYTTDIKPNLLSNKVDSLKLFDSRGAVIDTANLYGKTWFAGNLSTGCSMERARPNAPDSEGNWLTYARKTDLADPPRTRDGSTVICGSPGEKNWAYDVTPTPSPIPSPTSTLTPTAYPNSPIVLNELLVQPRQDHNGDGKIDGGDSFVEIANLGSTRISLKGWRLDDQEGDSPQYTIGDVGIDPGAKVVLYSSVTGIFFSAGADSVRLYKNAVDRVDVFTYKVNEKPGFSWCRYEDGWGGWVFGCTPSPTKANEFKPAEIGNLESKSNQCSFENLPVFLRETVCNEQPLTSILAGLEGWFDRLPIRIPILDSELLIE